MLAMSCDEKPNSLHIKRNTFSKVGLIPESGDIETPDDIRFFANDIGEVVGTLGVATSFIDIKDSVETALKLRRHRWNPLTLVEAGA